MITLRLFTFTVLLAALLFAAPAADAKGPPEGKGKGKSVKLLENTEEEAEDLGQQRKKKMKQQRKKLKKQQEQKPKGLEKQQAKKAEQVQKETGKGSEKGQAMREEHRKKWWKFWGDKEDPPEAAE